jgi:hypothetical protein
MTTCTKPDFEQLKEIEKIKHEYKMKELEYTRETEKIKHQFALEQQRIRSAEIRKSQQARWIQDQYKQKKEV